MAGVTIADLTRDEKLLVATALDVETEENTFDGHNTEWGDTVDVVLEGRKGLFDFSESELDEHLECFFTEVGADASQAEILASKEALILWAQRLSRIGRIDGATRKWEPVDPSIQEAWNEEDGEDDGGGILRDLTKD